MTGPLVSIICACYNQSQYIVESLESVKAQTYKNIEIIIWDDASKDNSVEIIENWISQNQELDIQFVRHEENKGICKSLNECFLLSKGKYIQLLALDDVLLPWKLKRHVGLLEQSSEKDALVFTDAYIMNEYSEKYTNRFMAYHIHYLNIESGNYFEQLIHSNFIPAMSVLLKRDVVENVGLWDEKLVFEDYDMWMRISRNYDFIFDDKVSVKYRLHSSNTHKKMESQLILDSFKIKLKHAEESSVRKMLEEYIEYKYLVKELNGEEIIYFNTFPAHSLSDKLINSKRFTLLYITLKKLKKIF
ncbi:glycosyltransferase family 2 protein [Elizabethkingia anophelis]|uniref:glycosyltransferase family 2 protein n=1 Tax=Elizabethkingia anophelis TaxID=1117645 RepID=UPI00293C51D2|nr:hypothetical protein [Elizabethkingia anophelis]